MCFELVWPGLFVLLVVGSFVRLVLTCFGVVGGTDNSREIAKRRKVLEMKVKKIREMYPVT